MPTGQVPLGDLLVVTSALGSGSAVLAGEARGADIADNDGTRQHSLCLWALLQEAAVATLPPSLPHQNARAVFVSSLQVQR